jgi:hypothetical protein
MGMAGPSDNDSPYRMIDNQKHDCSYRRHQDAMQIKPGNANVAEDMEEPATHNRSHNAKKSIEDNAFSVVIH